MQKGICSRNLDHSPTSKSLCNNLSITDSLEFGLSHLWKFQSVLCLCAPVFVYLTSLGRVFHANFHWALISRRSGSIGNGVLTLKSAANRYCQTIRMFLICLEICTQFGLTWTLTQTSQWSVIRWLRMLTSGEQLAWMHSQARKTGSDSAARFDKWHELFQI